MRRRSLALLVLAGCSSHRTEPVPEAVWRRVVGAPFTQLFADYRRQFVAVPIGDGPRRPHFAGDPKLTLDEAVTRWLLPTLYASEVVDGTDAVFIEGGYAITGMANVLRAHVPCPELIAHVGPKSSCGDATWQHVVDALRGDRAAADHSCRLARALCGIASP